jgi:hypothetical protein
MSERKGAAEPESPVASDRGPEAGHPEEREHAAERDERRRGALSPLDPVAIYERRTTRIREEIARNRRGEYTVPTWVLALALAAVIAVWILVLFVL